MKTKLFCIMLALMTIGFGYSMYGDWQHLNDKKPGVTPVITVNKNTQKPTDWRRFNSAGQSQKYTLLTGNDRDERAIKLLYAYNYTGAWVIWGVFINTARVYRIYPEVLLCITYADTSIGTNLKTTFNRGNVGNNDRGNKVGYDNIEQGIDAIGRVLNNRLLGSKNTIGELSPYGGGQGPFYATSQENRGVNVLNCLGMIRGKQINNDFSFRW